MFVFEVYYKQMIPRNEHLVSAMNNPEIAAKLSAETIKKAKNFIAMYSSYIRKVRMYNDRPIYTGSVQADVFKGGNDKVTGLLELRNYLSKVENMISKEIK